DGRALGEKGGSVVDQFAVPQLDGAPVGDDGCTGVSDGQAIRVDLAVDRPDAGAELRLRTLTGDLNTVEGCCHAFDADCVSTGGVDGQVLQGDGGSEVDIDAVNPSRSNGHPFGTLDRQRYGHFELARIGLSA